MRGDDIAGRLLGIGVEAGKLVEGLKPGHLSRHLGRQLVRCATGAGANYEEARGGESRADFVHKLGVALKEVRETLYWLRIVQRANLSSHADLKQLIDETGQLAAILTTSLRTARR